MPTTTTAHNPRHHQDVPLSDYFVTVDDPLHGNDPFFAAWDFDLQPEEYGDQSGHIANDWHDDHASFSSQEDNENENDNLSDDEGEEDDWNIVYAASFTVVASTTTYNGTSNATRKRRSLPTAVVVQQPLSSSPPCCTMSRRDSKVHFCEEPPEVNCYETCSRDQYSELYYSVHELQTIIDDLRQETNSSNNNKNNNSKGKTCTTTSNKPRSAAAPTRSV
jgi:hypothetical protein